MMKLLIVLGLLSASIAQKITFTLGKRQVKCFKDDFAADTVMDLFIDLYQELNPRLTKGGKEGIKVNVHGPKGNVIKNFVLSKETHEAYQIPIRVRGIYKVCLKPSQELFNGNNNAKFEMSLTLMTAHDSGQAKAVEDAAPQSAPADLLTREHMDRVDVQIETLTEKGEIILQDMRYQSQKQAQHQKEHEHFQSNFALCITVQILLLVGTVLWQVVSLRKFFVAKNIF